ncbi:hypothetical protein D3C81_1306540 [compost metagenome]
MPQLKQLGRNFLIPRFAQGDEIYVKRLDGADFDLLLLQNQCNPFESHSEPDARLIRAAHLSHQSVITSAAADRIDRTDALSLIFKRSVRIVVQTADETGINHIIDLHRTQQLLHFREM